LNFVAALGKAQNDFVRRPWWSKKPWVTS